jgi:hypothetical protein
MTGRQNKNHLDNMDEERRETLESLDQAERDLLDAIQRARAEFDREEAEAKLRFAAAREEVEKHRFSEKNG